MDAPGVVERRVVALGHRGRHHVVANADVRVVLQHVGDDAVHDAAHVHRVGQEDGHLEGALGLDPDAARHLARAVEHPGGGGNLLAPQITPVR